MSAYADSVGADVVDMKQWATSNRRGHKPAERTVWPEPAPPEFVAQILAEMRARLDPDAT